MASLRSHSVTDVSSEVKSRPEQKVAEPLTLDAGLMLGIGREEIEWEELAIVALVCRATSFVHVVVAIVMAVRKTTMKRESSFGIVSANRWPQTITLCKRLEYVGFFG